MSTQRKYMEGWVEKKAAKWKKYYAVLIGRKIYFFKSANTEDRDNMMGHLEIGASDCVQRGETKKKYSIFVLTTQTGSYQLRVPNEAMREEWVHAILTASAASGSPKKRGSAIPPPVPTSARPSGLRSGSMSGGAAGRPLPPPPGGEPSASRVSSGGSTASTSWVSPAPDPHDPHGKESWNFGKTTRAQAEKLLVRHGSEGSFLVRASESTQGDFSLSVLDQGTPRHYKISATPRGLLLTGCEDELFVDIKALVDYYITASHGQSDPLDKFAVERLEEAFEGPAVVRAGMMLPGMRIQMEEEMRRLSVSGSPRS